MFEDFKAIRERLHELQEENIRRIAEEFGLSESRAREIAIWCSLADTFNI